MMIYSSLFSARPSSTDGSEQKRRRQTPIITFSVIGILLSSTAQATLFDGRYGVNQVFDVQRNPAFPSDGNPITLSNFQQPYKDPFGAGQNYDIGIGYVAFKDSGDPTYLVTLEQFDANDNFVQAIAARGNVYGLGPEGFLLVGEFGTGTFISNNEGFSNGDSVTYMPDICSQPQCKATQNEIDDFDATTTPLADGQTAADVASSDAPAIDVSQSSFDLQDLANGDVSPKFNGGTLDTSAGGTVSEDFTVDAANGTIDTGGATSTFSGAISGPGKLKKSGSGALVLSGANTLAGGFDVTAGVLAPTTAGALGNGPVAFNGGGLSPGAAMTIANTLSIGASGGNLNAGNGDVTLSGALTGNGLLTKTGADALNVTGNPDFAGDVAIDEGKLEISGNFGDRARIVVRDGAFLSGNATLHADVSVESGGSLGPGASPGTITVTGDVVFEEGGVLAIEVDGKGTGNGAGNFDRIITTNGGRFTANGTVAPQLRGISAPANNNFTPALGDSFRIIEADGGVTGRFVQITQPFSDLPANTRFDLLYGADSVSLFLVPANLLQTARLFGTSNAGRAGDALDAVRPAIITDDDVLFAGLIGFDRPTTAEVLDQISGEVYAFAEMSARQGSRLLRDIVMRQALPPQDRRGQPADQVRLDGADRSVGEALVGNGTDRRADMVMLGEALDRTFRDRRLWFQGFRQAGGVDRDAEASAYRTDRQGFVAGADLVQTEAYVVGLAAGGGHNRLDAGSSGEAEITQFSLIGYVRDSFGSEHHDALQWAGSLGATVEVADVNRTVNLANGTRSAESDYTSWSMHTDWRVARPVEFGHVTIDLPIVGLQAEYRDTGDVEESGDALIALDKSSDNNLTAATRLGSRLHHSSEVDGKPIDISLGLAWHFEFDKDRIARADVALDDVDWWVRAPRSSRHSAELEASLGLGMFDNTTLEVSYTGRANGAENSHLATIGLVMNW